MNTIGEQLKRAREERGRTLEEIANAIRINRKHLEQLEEGNFPELPQTYLRAFIKDYAREVGLNPFELFKQLEAAETNSDSEKKQEVSEIVSFQKKTRQLDILLTITVLTGLGLAISILWKHNSLRSQPIQEIPFAEAVKNEERERSKEQMPFSFDSSLIQFSAGIKSDSLLLEGVASESVWVRIVADGMRAKEYKLKPHNTIRLKSKNYFALSLSNARAMSFLLNGQKIGELAAIRKPLWNVTLSWDSMRKVLLSKERLPAKDSILKTNNKRNEQKSQH